MTRLRIDFAPSRRWLVPWALWLMTIAIAAGTAVAWHRSAQRLVAENEDEAASIGARVKSSQREKEQAASAAARDPNSQQMSQIRSRLQFDWNPAFATIENIEVPGARLASMSATAGETIRIEYRVTSIAVASELTTQLNAGRASPVWHLETVTVAPHTGSFLDEMQATWTAALIQLH